MRVACSLLNFEIKSFRLFWYFGRRAASVCQRNGKTGRPSTRANSHKREKRKPQASVSPYTSFVLTSLAACLILNGARLKLIYLLNKPHCMYPRLCVLCNWRFCDTYHIVLSGISLFCFLKCCMAPKSQCQAYIQYCKDLARGVREAWMDGGDGTWTRGQERHGWMDGTGWWNWDIGMWEAWMDGGDETWTRGWERHGWMDGTGWWNWDIGMWEAWMDGGDGTWTRGQERHGWMDGTGRWNWDIGMWEAWMDGGDETWTRGWETWIDGCMGG